MRQNGADPTGSGFTKLFNAGTVNAVLPTRFDLDKKHLEKLRGSSKQIRSLISKDKASNCMVSTSFWLLYLNFYK
jgi:hypothetical protein